MLKVWPTDFEHFLYVAFQEISSLENTSNSIDSGKNICIFFKFYYLSEQNETGGNLWYWKRSKRLYIWCAIGNAWDIFIVPEKNDCCNQYFCFVRSISAIISYVSPSNKSGSPRNAQSKQESFCMSTANITRFNSLFKLCCVACPLPMVCRAGSRATQLARRSTLTTNLVQVQQVSATSAFLFPQTLLKRGSLPCHTTRRYAALLRDLLQKQLRFYMTRSRENAFLQAAQTMQCTFKNGNAIPRLDGKLSSSCVASDLHIYQGDIHRIQHLCRYGRHTTRQIGPKERCCACSFPQLLQMPVKTHAPVRTRHQGRYYGRITNGSEVRVNCYDSLNSRI